MFSYIFFLKSGDYYDKTASAKSYLPKSLPLEAFELKSESFNELRDNVYWLQMWANTVFWTEYEYEYYSESEFWPNTNNICAFRMSEDEYE